MVDNISVEEPTMAVREDQMVLEEAAGKSTDEGSGDEGGRRLRIVGNSGRDRRVALTLQAIGDTRCVGVPEAERLTWLVAHGWAYLLTDQGSGRLALRTGLDAMADVGPAVARQQPGTVDLVVAHEVQPTSPKVPLTMAW